MKRKRPEPSRRPGDMTLREAVSAARQQPAKRKGDRDPQHKRKSDWRKQLTGFLDQIDAAKSLDDLPENLRTQMEFIERIRTAESAGDREREIELRMRFRAWGETIRHEQRAYQERMLEPLLTAYNVDRDENPWITLAYRLALDLNLFAEDGAPKKWNDRSFAQLIIDVRSARRSIAKDGERSVDSVKILEACHRVRADHPERYRIKGRGANDSAATLSAETLEKYYKTAPIAAFDLADRLERSEGLAS